MERVGRRVAGSKMEDVDRGKIGGDEADDGSKYARELDVAVRVLHMVSSLCRSVQEELLSTNADLTKIKGDNSLVTVAGTPPLLLTATSSLHQHFTLLHCPPFYFIFLYFFIYSVFNWLLLLALLLFCI